MTDSGRIRWALCVSMAAVLVACGGNVAHDEQANTAGTGVGGKTTSGTGLDGSALRSAGGAAPIDGSLPEGGRGSGEGGRWSAEGGSPGLGGGAAYGGDANGGAFGSSASTGGASGRSSGADGGWDGAVDDGARRDADPGFDALLDVSRGDADTGVEAGPPLCHTGCAVATMPTDSRVSAGTAFMFLLELASAKDLAGARVTCRFCLKSYGSGGLAFTPVDDTPEFATGTYVTLADLDSLSCATGMHEVEVPIAGPLDTSRVRWLELRMVPSQPVSIESPWVAYIDSFTFHDVPADSGTVGPFSFETSVSENGAKFLVAYTQSNMRVTWFSE